MVVISCDDDWLLGFIHGSQATSTDAHLLLATIYCHCNFLNVGFPMPFSGLQRERPVVSKLASFATNFTLGHRKGAPFTTQADVRLGLARQRQGLYHKSKKSANEIERDDGRWIRG